MGIHYNVDLTKINKLNYDKKLVKIKSIIEQWKKRNFTPIGRITHIKSLIKDQLNHLFITLPNPQPVIMKELNSIIFRFLWNSDVDKVKRKIVTQKYSQGGLKMLD